MGICFRTSFHCLSSFCKIALFIYFFFTWGYHIPRKILFMTKPWIQISVLVGMQKRWTGSWASARLQGVPPPRYRPSLGDVLGQDFFWTGIFNCFLPGFLLWGSFYWGLKLNKNICVSSQNSCLITTEVCELHPNDMRRTWPKRLHAGSIFFLWEDVNFVLLLFCLFALHRELRSELLIQYVNMLFVNSDMEAVYQRTVEDEWQKSVVSFSFAFLC